MTDDTAARVPGLSSRVPSAGPGEGQRLGLALLVISLTQLMLVLDELIVNTALPHIQQALHFSGTSLEWLVTGYAVTFGGLLMLGGRAGDILGRRRVLTAGIGIFSLASLAAGLATASWLLIAARIVQGAGAAFAAPAALSLITVTFPEGRARTRALGVYAAMTGMGGGVGVVAGGLLTTYASWRWVFFVNVPIGLALVIGARYALPESRRHPRRWDLPGAVTGTAGLGLLIYGLTRAATGPDGIAHWSDATTIAALAGAAAALLAFVAIEARSAQPLLPLWIFANRTRTGVYLILVCLASVFFAMFFFLTLFTQVVWGYSPLRGGLAYLPFIGAFIVSAGVCTRLAPRLGARVPITVGAVLAPAGMFWLSRVHEHSQYLTGVCLPMVVFAAAAGLIFVPLTTILVAGISDEHAGVASSMFNVGQQVGGAVGLAVIGSVAWTTVSDHLRQSPATLAGQPGYGHALSFGVTQALTIGAGTTVLALIITIAAILARRGRPISSSLVRRCDAARRAHGVDPGPDTFDDGRVGSQRDGPAVKGVEIDQARAHEGIGEPDVLLVEPDELGQDAVVRFQAQPSAGLGARRLERDEALAPARREYASGDADALRVVAELVVEL
jgi:EmrB/QacA subfamily drug resistance transporter